MDMTALSCRLIARSSTLACLHDSPTLSHASQQGDTVSDTIAGNGIAAPGDGYGRVGRLIVTQFLRAGGVLCEPLLYLSLFLKTNRVDDCRLLQELGENGAWEA